jgi:metal-responsive CopG/Arc/MetJ family transcriptional regulator
MQRIGTKITVTVPDDLLKEIETLSSRFGMSKAEVSRRLIEVGLDVYKVYKPTGLIKLIEIVRKYKFRNVERTSLPKEE